MLRPEVANVPKGGGIITDLPWMKQPPGPPGVTPLMVCIPIPAIVGPPNWLAAAAQAVANAMACADPGRNVSWVPGVVCVQLTVAIFVKSPVQDGIEF